MKCLKVPIKKGEETLKILRQHSLKADGFKIMRENGFLLIPVKETVTVKDLENVRNRIGSLELVECKVEKVEQKKISITDFLRGKLPEELLNFIPSSFDVIGHVAIVKIPLELKKYEQLIGQALIETHKNIKTVLAKETAVTGKFRLRDFRLIAGENKTETIHKEYGCSFFLDVKKTFFSPRLANEHFRISSLVNEGETIVDMFAGVGPFSILIAKKHRNVKVYAIDANPDAIEYLKRNIALNKVEDKVFPILGDVEEASKSIEKEKINRVIMNLPEESFRYLKTACNLLKVGGIIHFYCFEDEPNPLEKASRKLKEAVKTVSGRDGKIIFGKLVKEVAPRRWMIGLDFLLLKS